MIGLNGKFSDIHDSLTILLSKARIVDTGEWQAIQGAPQSRTIEAQDVSFEIPIPGHEVLQWTADIRPNIPWAEDHFLERVSGVPHNPPPSHEWWPHAQRANDEHREAGKFSHTYPERFWPTYAGDRTQALEGVRYPAGDLADLVELLQGRPGTRQAYLPVWFPEDLAAANRHEQRVPCTLGYHFLIRDGKLKIVYYIRSCDFYRHFRDDVYMAGRLAQWVAEKISNGVTPTKLVMHISSLHIFEAERELITTQANKVMTHRLGNM